MKSFKFVLLLLAIGAAAISSVDLGNVHSVYVLPMAHGLDQYLASTLTTQHVFVIVSDPKMADAVLTEHVNAALQQKLDTLLAPPPPKTDAKADKDESPKGTLLEPANKIDNPADNSSVGRSKGTIFLIGTKSRQVLWSTYDLPKDSSSKELDRIAFAIVSRLMKDMGMGKR